MLTSRGGEGKKKKEPLHTHTYAYTYRRLIMISRCFFFFFSLQFLSLSVARFSFVTNVTSNKACESKSMSDFLLDSPRFHALHLENTSRNSLEPIPELTVLYIYTLRLRLHVTSCSLLFESWGCWIRFKG